MGNRSIPVETKQEALDRVEKALHDSLLDEYLEMVEILNRGESNNTYGEHSKP